MSLRWNPRTLEFVVTTSQSVKAEDTGLTLSRTASGPNGEPVYFTKDPYAALNFYKEADRGVIDKLAPLWADYEKSWATTSVTHHPIGREIVELGGLRDYQNAAIDYALTRPNTLIGDAPGIGKAQPLYAKVQTPNGPRAIGDLHVGDGVCGYDGKGGRVTGVFDRGVMDVFEITFSDGAVTRASADHLWHVRTSRKYGWQVMPTWMVAEKMKRGKVYIPIASPVGGAAARLPVEPYVLGILLGDGCFRGGTPSVSTADDEIKRACAEEASRLQLMFRYKAQYDYVFSGGQHGGIRNRLTAILRTLNLWGLKSQEKFIPEKYVRANATARLELLRGLMDSDGWCTDARPFFASTSERLAKGVVGLAQSLGGIGRVTHDKKKNVWNVSLNTPKCPFKLTRKANLWRCNEHYTPARLFKSIRLVGAEPVRCISVTCKDNLYLTDDFIVTHNTLTAVGACNAIGAEKILVVCPAAIRSQWRTEIKRGSILDKVRCYPILRSADGVANWPNYTIISYDLLRNPALHAALCAIKWDALILDEAHALKEVGARRTQALFGGGKRAEFQDPLAEHAKRIFALTGTPLPNRPRECYTISRSLCFEAIGFMSEDKFRHRFNPSGMLSTGHVREERGRLPELQARLRCNFMVRRLKEDVLKDLPDKTYEFAYIEKDGRISDIIRRERMLNYSVSDLKKPQVQMFGEIATIRREMGEAKVPQTIMHMRHLLDTVELEKVVMFSYHRGVMDSLRQALSPYGVVEIRGGMNQKDRDAAIFEFVNNPKVRIFSGQIDAAGVGIDGLQKVCSHVVVVEPAWTSGSNEQAIDRLHRSGQHGNVIAQFIVVEGSLDERILASVINKTQTIHEALDNKKSKGHA